MTDQTQVLVATGDATSAMSLQQNLTELGYSVRHASSSEQAIIEAEQGRPEVAIIQLDMPEAVETACELQKKHGLSVILVVDAARGIGDAPITELGPVGLISEPLRGWELSAMVLSAAAATKRQAARREREHLLNEIVDGMLDSVVIVDHQGLVTFANATCSRVLKQPPTDIQGTQFGAIFPADGHGNVEITAIMDTIYAGACDAIGSGGPGTIADTAGSRHRVVVLLNPLRADGETVSAVSVSFRFPSPVQNSESSQASSSGVAAQPEQGSLDMAGRGELASLRSGGQLRAIAIRAITLKNGALMSKGSKRRTYAVVLVLNLFDMFRVRYGIKSAERLLGALSAQVLRGLSTDDRLHQWSDRCIVALCERDCSLEEVRVEMTALCSRRIDYFLNASDRSALVTLSATWAVLPLGDSVLLEKVIEQIDGLSANRPTA